MKVMKYEHDNCREICLVIESMNLEDEDGVCLSIVIEDRYFSKALERSSGEITRRPSFHCFSERSIKEISYEDIKG